MKRLLLRNWPFLVIILVVVLFFWKVFLLKEAPIPGDLIVGAYYPWLDYKWGYEVGVPVKNAVTSDVVSIVYPLRSLAVDLFKQGHLPLWNSTTFGGTPLLADFPVAVFSPSIIFYFFLPKIWAWTSQIMIQPILAAAFTYLLLRHFGLKKLESVLGGIFFAFSAFSIIWMEWNANSLVAAFIPLLILFLDKFINSRKLYWGVLLSVGICFQMLSGYPQLVIFTMMVLLIFVIFRWEKLTWMKVFQIVLFVFAGILLSSILTIPSLELILNSQRRYEVLEPAFISLPWQNLITFLAPDYFGNPATGNYFGIGNYTINAGYSGIIVLILSIVGVLQNWEKREVKYFLTLLVFALLIALPTPFAVALFNSHIPLFSAASNTRILVLANLSLGVLAGFGIFSLFRKEKIKKVGIIFIPLIILLATVVLTFFIKTRGSVSLRNLILPIGLSLFVGILILLKKKIFILILCFLAVAELFRYGWKYTPFSSPGLVFPETPVLTFFQNTDPPFRVSPGDVIPMNMWVPYNIESISGYDALYPVWWARLLSVINNQSPEYGTFSYYAPFEQYESRWFDLLNNRYLFVLTPSKESDWSLAAKIQKIDKFKKVFQDKSVSIFENKDVLPRAFFVSDWEVLSDEETLKKLIDPKFPLNRKIIIDKNPGIEKSNGAKSGIHYDFYSAEKSILNINTDKDGLLFVSDAWYPGWKAKVDGKDAFIYRADYAFRAVAVTKGIHNVEFIYDPESLRMGELLSLIAVLFLAGIIFYDIKKLDERIF
jgi:hypothetical protein